MKVYRNINIRLLIKQKEANDDFMKRCDRIRMVFLESQPGTRIKAS